MHRLVVILRMRGPAVVRPKINDFLAYTNDSVVCTLQSMLARNRFDPEALVRVVNAVELRGEYQPLQPLGETDIEVSMFCTQGLHFCRCCACNDDGDGVFIWKATKQRSPRG